MLIAVAFGLASALVHAIASVVQQRSAAAVPLQDGGELSLIWRLVRTPRWLLAKSGDFVGLLLQAVAFHYGSLIVVQAIATTTVLLALVISAAHDHRRMEPREWVGALGIVLGLAMLIGVGRPEANGVAHALQWVVAALGVLAVAGASAAMARRRSGEESAAWLALAAGVVFGLDAAFLKRGVDLSGSGHGWHALAWFGAYVVCSLAGNVAMARAFQSGSLRASLPILTAVTPVAALALGPLLFHEALHRGARLGVALAGAGLTIAAGVVCARSEAEHLPATDPRPVPQRP